MYSFAGAFVHLDGVFAQVSLQHGMEHGGTSLYWYWLWQPAFLGRLMVDESLIVDHMYNLNNCKSEICSQRSVQPLEEVVNSIN